MATTISSASSPSRSRIVSAPTKVEASLAWSGASAASASSNSASSRGDCGARPRAGLAAAVDAGAKLAHLASRPWPASVAIARAEHRLDRLEAVEIGGQRQRLRPGRGRPRDRRRGSAASRSRATARLDAFAGRPRRDARADKRSRRRPCRRRSAPRAGFRRVRSARSRSGTLRVQRRIAVPDRLALLRQRDRDKRSGRRGKRAPICPASGSCAKLCIAVPSRPWLITWYRANGLRWLRRGRGRRRRSAADRAGAPSPCARRPWRRGRLAQFSLEQLRAARQVRRLPAGRAAPDKRRADAGRGRGRSARRPLGWPWLDQRRESLALGDQRSAFAGLAGSAAILSAAEAENSRISAYSDALTTFRRAPRRRNRPPDSRAAARWSARRAGAAAGRRRRGAGEQQRRGSG